MDTKQMEITVKNLATLLLIILANLFIQTSLAYPSMSEKDIVFKISPAFTRYFGAYTSAIRAQSRLEKQGLDEENIKKLKSELNKYKIEYYNESVRLENLLEKASQKYKTLKPEIADLIEWVRKVNITNVSKDEERQWLRSYDKRTSGIINKLKKASGIANIENQKEQYIMSLLPRAVNDLKNHQNDSALCSVMSAYGTSEDNRLQLSPIDIARRIAFIDYGDRYCTQFYHKRSSWGITRAIPKTKNGKLDAIPFDVYYHKYVAKEIPKAKARLRRNEDIDCVMRGGRFISSDRDPFIYAIRVAYRSKEGQEICRKIIMNDKNDYNYTSYSCIEKSRFMCGESSPGMCDAFEFCKPRNGLLFKDY